MTEASVITIRILGLLAGGLCLYIAFFLYEDEEGHVQNALENLWIRINDRSDGGSTRVRRLLTETADLNSRVFDAVFGPRLWSKRAVGVSFAYAFASMSVYLIVAMGRSNVAALWTMPLIFFAFGSLPALAGSERLTRLVFLLPLAFAIFLPVFTWIVASDYVRRHDPAGLEFLLINYIFVGSLLLSAPIDFLWSLLARWTSRKVSESQRLLPALIALLVHLAALGILLAFLRFKLIADVIHWNEWIGSIVAVLIASRLFLVATASVFTAVIAVVLLHKIVWPVADRAIYALARHRVLQNRRLIGVLARAHRGLGRQRGVQSSAVSVVALSTAFPSSTVPVACPAEPGELYPKASLSSASRGFGFC